MQVLLGCSLAFDSFYLLHRSAAPVSSLKFLDFSAGMGLESLGSLYECRLMYSVKLEMATDSVKVRNGHLDPWDTP